MLGYSELSDDMRPPEDIWLDDEALNLHFENVKASMRSGSPMEDIPSEQNELTRDIRRGG